MPWPSTDADDHTAAPIAFWGTGVDPAASISDRAGLDDVADTVAEVIGLDRPHPQVRSGEALPGVATGDRPRLVVIAALEGVGSRDLEAGSWPTLHRLIAKGAGTPAATILWSPLDPAAILTTIGTGGIPAQHGITGRWIRDDKGHLVRAWGKRSPPSIIATLADHLDELYRERPRIGLAAPSRSYRGLVGGNWYLDGDQDDLTFDEDIVSSTRAILSKGYGHDSVPDLLGVVISKDRELHAVIRAAEKATEDVAVVAAGTGSMSSEGKAIDYRMVVNRLTREFGEIVEAPAVGGLFLDQGALEETETSDDDVISALRSMRVGSEVVFEDVFGGLAVSFGRFC
jgi:hypothetical protein